MSGPKPLNQQQAVWPAQMLFAPESTEVLHRTAKTALVA